ncbi:MAG: hypothetical protein K9M15_01600 [Candidatus Marinimicrobia bacterium]|nr:hypothetical protein [Candidatus Neomarinimicrobiota bacterium]
MIVLDTIRGLSDSKFSGILGSVYRSVGLDLHSEPGLLKVHQALAKNSGTTVTEFCRVSLTTSVGNDLWFSYTSGKIWERTSGGTWRLVHTTTPAAGNAGCLGAFEFNGYIYWATQSRLHRIAVADCDDNDWASDATEDWATFSITDSSWHPMVIQDLTLFIGDGYYIASVDSSGTFTANSLDLKTPYRVKCLIDYEEDILIGTFVNTNVNKTEVLRWDCISPSWNTSDPIEEVGINCFIRDDNYVYVQAGRAGNLYYYNGSQLEPYQKIPGTYSNVSYGEVYPNSNANFKGIPIFGFSNSSEAANTTGNPALQGVYSFGSYSRNYSKIMDLSWVISQDKTSSIEIGSILVRDFDLYVAWKDGTSYGVDKIDYSNKYSSAYFETMILFQDLKNNSKSLARVMSGYNSLPTGTGLTFYYSVNGGSYVSVSSETKVNSILNEIYAELREESVRTLQIKVAFTVSNNDAPTLDLPLDVEIN